MKVVGGGSSCAQKVPWNVLIELVSGLKLSASGKYKGNHLICSIIIKHPAK